MHHHLRVDRALAADLEELGPPGQLQPGWLSAVLLQMVTPTGSKCGKEQDCQIVRSSRGEGHLALASPLEPSTSSTSNPLPARARFILRGLQSMSQIWTATSGNDLNHLAGQDVLHLALRQLLHHCL